MDPTQSQEHQFYKAQMLIHNTTRIKCYVYKRYKVVLFISDKFTFQKCKISPSCWAAVGPFCSLRGDTKRFGDGDFLLPTKRNFDFNNQCILEGVAGLRPGGPLRRYHTGSPFLFTCTSAYIFFIILPTQLHIIISDYAVNCSNTPSKYGCGRDTSLCRS